MIGGSDSDAPSNFYYLYLFNIQSVKEKFTRLLHYRTFSGDLCCIFAVSFGDAYFFRRDIIASDRRL